MVKGSKNKLWCFGDSFTYGQGCRKGFEYFDKYPELREEIWPDIVGRELGLQTVNLGKPGNSNPFIINQVINSLPLFKENDFVILSDTLPYRLVHPDERRYGIQPLTTDIIVNSHHHTDRELLSIKTKEEQEAVLKYVLESIIGYEDLWTSYYFEQFFGFYKHLTSLGIKVFFWSHNIWALPNGFDTISGSTQGKIKDSHWSWKGHRYFSKYLLNRIETKDTGFLNKLL